MAFQFFTLPIHNNAEAADEMNRFLDSHRVLAVDRRWVDLGENSFWAFCIDYLETQRADPFSRGGPGRPKVDYKDVLKPEEFAVFARLRDVRKELATAEAVPAYTIMTNEQLAQIVQRRCATAKDLENVVGVGESRIAKYGAAVLAVMQSSGILGYEAAGNLFDKIVGRDNLRLAFYLAGKGKRAGAEVRAFAGSLDDRLRVLGGQIADGTVAVGIFRQFVIRDPKERIITAPAFEERVLHHAVMNVCEPVLDRYLIEDTYACRPGRGRVAAVLRAKHFAARHSHFLKMDIRKYFDSIAHERLLALLRTRFKDERLLALLGRIVSGYRGAIGCGLPIGSLTSQHFANFYLGRLDRFIKQELQISGYVRYMDDTAIWGNSSVELVGVMERCRAYLGGELSLDLNAHSHVNRTRVGMGFLGCRVFPNRLLLKRSAMKRYRRKLRDIDSALRDGLMGEADAQRRATALTEFTRAAGVASFLFRAGVLQSLEVGGR